MSVSPEETRSVEGPTLLDSGFRRNDEGSASGAGSETDMTKKSDVGSFAYRAWDFWVKRSWMLWVLAAVVLLLDQSTKSMIIAWLDWGQSWPAEGFFRITHARNTGTAFSLFQGHSTILSFVAMFAVAVLLWVYATTGAKSFVLRFALGLQLGGALGNLLDRLRLGYVTDFLDVGPWPIFNAADSAISIGMVLMVLYFVTAKDEKTVEDSVATAVEPVDGGCRHCDEAMEFGTSNGAIDDVADDEIRT